MAAVPRVTPGRGAPVLMDEARRRGLRRGLIVGSSFFHPGNRNAREIREGGDHLAFSGRFNSSFCFATSAGTPAGAALARPTEVSFGELARGAVGADAVG